jgi:cellulose synthase/poly-beta-1,6-N-acetylglucosamine synthase-like glycosyltransferase
MKKRAILIVLPVVVWCTLGAAAIWPWMRGLDQHRPLFSIVAHISFGIWWLVLLWALHHLAFQLRAMFFRPACLAESGVSPSPAVAVLYTTCDDFDEGCCSSCIGQDYEDVRVYVLDDSSDAAYVARVRAFVQAHSDRCRYVTRSNRTGFKAGNINNALRNHVTEDWFLLVDADQRLPDDFVRRLVAKLPAIGEGVIFVQGAHQARQDGPRSEFEETLGPEVSIFYDRDLVPRTDFGFVPLLGHGALIRRSECLDLGGFPELVSEDFAFALRAAGRGWRGTFAADVASTEAYPHDFGAFMIRLKKFAAGTAELLRREHSAFLAGSASKVEKWDFAMAMLWYVLMPLLVANGFLSAYVVHELWSGHIPYIHPLLPYLYTWLLVAIVSLVYSVAGSWAKAIRFYFWSTAIYTSALPVAAWSFIKHLFASASFQRTPKSGRHTPVSRLDAVASACLGFLALACGVIWLSPFSPVVMAQGVAYASYGLYAHLGMRSSVGAVARTVIWIPGVLHLLGLAAVWHYAY